VELLRHEKPKFVASDMTTAWTLNLVDYCIWGVMPERVYDMPSQDVAELRHRLMCMWFGLQQSVVDEAIDSG